ncbi:PREDICTED: TATA box-binding protein-associated factor, RNA polymerase I, subunit C-like [Elephantulus edwardii]|uniref:TATA box-binding protein-associated factor, RNA polymerase I, subunit C-like n=1 Tax=Elephantulus edwardii TaxID=28737 RepID=UPI0003F0B425|nr:PREDICTED: TATA box-binding protein-associated factor, RNA polymerase I, subunit C-like [Elephantulus edwardii]
MDFPCPLPPTLFLSGPLGLSNAPDLSSLCSWKDALTLPECPYPSGQNVAPCLTGHLRWEPATPGPFPLLPPSPDPWDPGLNAQDLLFRSSDHFRRQPRPTLDVTEQLSHFLWDHGDIAFGPLGSLLQEHFKLQGARSRSKKKTVVSVQRMFQDLGGHQPWGCPGASISTKQRRFSILGAPILGKWATSLLGELLQEELAGHWRQLLLDDTFTGGALAWLPGNTASAGQLVYPSSGALDTLCFQEVSLTPGGDPQVLGDPGHIQLRGPVRQVVTRTIQGEALLGVRSDYHCAVWKVGKQGQPAPLQVLHVDKGATGISLSPHLPGELAVCSRSGTVCLWTPQDGLQQVYKDPETLVFRDPSPWRWADFTAHPRVLTIGDRTGVKLVDTQGPPGSGLLLFRGGAEASCQKGERILLVQYLGASSTPSLSPTLHLVCTQFSLYLVDERLPLVPMLKWTHGLSSAPLHAQLLPAPRPGAPRPLLLGGQGGQLQLLHLSGEEASTPRLAGPPQSLPARTDALSGFPLLDPVEQHRLQERLRAPSTGLVAAVPPASSTPGLALFHLSAAGDLFYQHLYLQEGPGHSDTDLPSDPSPEPRVPTTMSWTPHATAHCSRWLEALLKVPRSSPVWTVPTFSIRRHLPGYKEQPRGEGTVLSALRSAMAQGRLLRPRDAGSLLVAEPPPAPESSPEDELSERLSEAWEGRGRAWWKRHLDRGSGLRHQPRRHKRRSQLSSTFSSLSSRWDFSEGPSLPPSPDQASPGPRPPPTPPSQDLSQEPWAHSVPKERRQTLRDYMARLPPSSPRATSTPPSQDLTQEQQQSLQDTMDKPLPSCRRTTSTPPSQGLSQKQQQTLQDSMDTPLPSGPRAATAPPSQGLSQEPWARNIPKERQQTLQDSMVKLRPPGSRADSAPASQASTIWSTPSRQQPPRKKSRMGF